MRDLQTLLDDFYRDSRLTGVCAAVVGGQHDLDIAASGVRRAGRDTPVTVADRWHIGSNAKSMTAVLCARIVEQGKLQWSTPISEVLGDITYNAPKEIRDITLTKLLSHGSGVRDRAFLSWIRQARDDMTSPTAQRIELTTRLVTASKWAQPSSRGCYSNFGYCIAATMLERLTGSSWEDLMHEQVFRPLGMDTAGFGVPGIDGSGQPWGHAGFFRATPKDPTLRSSDLPPAVAPAGGIHADLRDWGQFARIFFTNHNRPAIISAESIVRLTTPLTVLKEMRTGFHASPYALGWIVSQAKWAHGEMLLHAGSNMNFLASIQIAPKRNLAFLVATNTGFFRAMKSVERLQSLLVAAYR